AGSAGARLFSCSFASTKASIGLRTQSLATVGTAGDLSGRNDHQTSGVESAKTPAAHTSRIEISRRMRMTVRRDWGVGRQPAPPFFSVYAITFSLANAMCDCLLVSESPPCETDARFKPFGIRNFWRLGKFVALFGEQPRPDVACRFVDFRHYDCG